MKCCLVKQEACDKKAVIVFSFYDIAVLCHLLERNLAELGCIIPSLKFDLAFCLIVFDAGQPVLSYGGEKGLYALRITLGLVNCAFESTVGPHDLAVFIQKRIRKIQLSQELSLYLSVFRGKAH